MLRNGLTGAKEWTYRFPMATGRVAPYHSGIWSLGIWGFPKIRGAILGVPIVRAVIFWGLLWGLLWGPPILGNYHIIVFAIPKQHTVKYTHSKHPEALTWKLRGT